ncbi:hypothetical protein ANCDUO_15975 [Ancylostoma duodenale]|uniref:CX domain-containing protein n=1 Tax=Ancylostoma duodenale TaxID=51022 RepID=A0A0C2CVK9_9BILA|nr:hypothetical protein ANCDUO_15975 [Ancylostoma duodenale]
MVILLLLSLLTCARASELSCAGHFPIKESVEIVRKLVEKYAIPVVRKDDNGVEWMNNLIVKNQGLEIDGTRYFLNDNRLPPEMTFYFDDSLLLHAVPLFVVGEDQLDNWRPDFPDKTYALTKISHQCAVGQRACGLKCCYSESDKIQKGFIELSQGGNLSSTSTYSYNDVTYSLEITDNSSTPKCSYDLSYHDVLFRRATVAGKPVSFQSSTSTYLVIDLQYSLYGPLIPAFSFKLDQRRKNILLMGGALVAFTAFVGITFVNYRWAV